MSRRPPIPAGSESDVAAGRRLTLTPIGFDIVIALSQAPGGMRLSSLSHAIGSPLSSVQAALRILVANELTERHESPPPSYRLAAGHPAHDRLIALARVLAEPTHALAITLRANEGVVFAAADHGGFMAALADEPPPGARPRLNAALDEIRAARSGTPPVEVTDVGEFARLLDVSIGLRARVAAAGALKGRPPRGSRSSSGARTAATAASKQFIL
jgi:hypothetical protein